jgi:Ca2+/Na+ antiporter
MELAYDHSSAAHDHHWHYGGLVNQPNFLNGGADATQDTGDGVSKPLLNDSSRAEAIMEKPPLAEVPGFNDAPWEVIPLEDVLYCERAHDQKHFNLHVHRHDNHLGSLITLELSSGDTQVMDAWVSALCTKHMEQRRTTTDAPPPPSKIALLMEWIEWLQFPVRFWVARTIPDMDDPKMQHLYPLSFVMSMVWLAIFAFTVTKACDGIHTDFGISTTVLGFTVAAAGTSFPNVFSGMCVARQGKTSMAVANALGANVQNVFLALAVPWTIQSFLINRGPFPMPVDMLMTAVASCFITLVPVVLIYICHGSSLPRWAGGLFLVMYLVYVVFAIGEQVSHCPLWPLSCS